MQNNDWIKKYDEEGWAGPFPLLNQHEIQKLKYCYDNNKEKFTYRDYRLDYKNNLSFQWFKSAHVLFPEYRKILENPALKRRISELLGMHAVAWGMTVTSRLPGQIHRWHGDVEHFKWNGVTAFIGLSNASNNASLKVITRSHKWNELPQQYNIREDSKLIDIAMSKDINSRLITIPINNGEFFIFDGKLWHGSENKSNKTRLAIIVQFASSQNDIRIPLNYDEPIEWANYPPPTIAIC